MSSHSSDDSRRDSSGGYSEDEIFQGPTSYAASHAYGISIEKMLSHLGITLNIAPASDGTTAWFEYEQLIDDWCDIDVRVVFTIRVTIKIFPGPDFPGGRLL